MLTSTFNRVVKHVIVIETISMKKNTNINGKMLSTFIRISLRTILSLSVRVSRNQRVENTKSPLEIHNVLAQKIKV